LLKDCEKGLKNLNILSEAILNQGDKIDKSIDHMLLTAQIINEESMKCNNLYLHKLL